MLRVHTDVFMKVYWYSISSVTTMVVTLPPSPIRSVSDREDSIYLSLPYGPFDVSGIWSDSPAPPSLMFLPGLHMVPNYFPLADACPDNHILDEPFRELGSLRLIPTAIYDLFNNEARLLVNFIGHRRILLASGISAFAVWLQQSDIEHRMD